jgi:hypothetical protein
MMNTNSTVQHGSATSRVAGRALWFLVMSGAVSCAGIPAGGEEPDPFAPAPDGPGLAGACHQLYAQDILPTFEVTLAPEVWEALVEDQTLRAEREAAGENFKPYRPVEHFRWGDHTATNASIRLKGQKSWYGSKLQFVISFNEREKGGRFLGLRKLVLEATPGIDRSLLRDRLALSFLRDLGVPTPCANSATLVVNGKLYGVYANIERVDKEFLQRNFGKLNAGGSLYKAGWTLKTNAAGEDRSRLWRLWAVNDADQLAELASLDDMLSMWAGEAVIPQADGYFVGRGNYYIYDHPTRGFVWIPWDLDKTFDFADPRADLIQYQGINKEKHVQYSVTISDPHLRGRYVDALEHAAAMYDPTVLVARIDTWAAQIAPAVAKDPNLGFTVFRHGLAVKALRDYVIARGAFLDDWLDCNRDELAWCSHCDEVACVVK